VRGTSNTSRGWSALLTAALSLPGSGLAATLATGDPAPAFSLSDYTGRIHRLGDYLGRGVVLYFYPKNDTPGCTQEACSFPDDIFVVRKLNGEALGVSVDSGQNHSRFLQKYGLPFTLLWDTDGATDERYGSLFSMGPLRFAKRRTFIIDPDGKIARIYRDVDLRHHIQQVIRGLRDIQAKRSD
jgi:peroxiredoxin Q/BCP